MLSCLCNVNRAVLTIQQVLLINILQSLLIIDLLSHEVKSIVLVVEIGCILRNN